MLLVDEQTAPYTDELDECIERLSKLKRSMPSSNSHMHTYLLEWAIYKRRLAEEIVNCLDKMVGGAIEEVYYVDLSGGGIATGDVGRDIDLIFVIDEKRLSNMDPREVERMFEEVLAKLVRAAGLEYENYTTAASLFEIHVVTRNSTSIYANLLRARQTPLIRLK